MYVQTSLMLEQQQQHQQQKRWWRRRCFVKKISCKRVFGLCISLEIQRSFAYRFAVRNLPKKKLVLFGDGDDGSKATVN